MCLEHFTSELELQFGSQVIPNPGTGTGLTPKKENHTLIPVPVPLLMPVLPFVPVQKPVANHV